jgi:CheY-like chemotaxis protein
MTNAINYNKENGTVTIRITKNNNNTIKLSITDTGIGIPKEQIDNLFLPFNRLDEYKFRVNGTGVGLTITKSLIQLMGGEIGVDSEVGKGSTFWFTLPTYNTETTVSEPAQSYTSATKQTTTNKSILVVEDDLINQELIITMLASMNINADVAGDGIEALDRIENNDYALILMDMNMPRMDGIETTIEIRKLKSYKNKLTIIALTANAMSGDKEKCLEAGMNDYIGKPVSLDTLRECINNWINK